MKDFNLEGLKLKLQDSVTSEIYQHSLRTMNEAEKLAKIYKIDHYKAKVAALLHDCGKLKNKKTDNLKHGPLGAQLAKNYYLIEDIDILNAIRYHTTGRVSMTMLEKIVYLADKIEADRNYPGVEEIRLLAYDNNIDKAIIKSLMNTIEYVKERNLELNKESVKALNYLIEGGNSI